MATIPLQAEWINAFLGEDGYQLVTLLRKEPRLLTIKYCGCNVLHLAMRHNWYSLVLEVLLKFEHLYKDASFLDQGFPSLLKVERRGRKVKEDVYGLDLASFRDLLEAKEDGGETSSRLEVQNTEDLMKFTYGVDLFKMNNFPSEKEYRGETAKLNYRSSLDVFAMAVIQGDGAINTLLAEAVLQVDGLFDHPHPYEHVVRFEGPGETGESNSSPDRHEEERKLLCEIIEGCFPIPLEVKIDYGDIVCFSRETGESNSSPDRHEEERKLQCEITEECFPVPIDVRVDPELKTVSGQPHAASNVSTSQQQRVTDSEAAPATSSTKQLEHQLADKINPEWKQRWLLTSPFSPLEEFLFLASFSSKHACDPSGLRSLEQGNFVREMERRMYLEDFVCSEKGISFQKYLVGIKDTRGSAIHHAVQADDTRWWFYHYHGHEIADCINVYDGAGRTPLYIALAEGGDGRLDWATSFLRNRATIVHNLKDTRNKCGRWEFRGCVWQANVATVSAVNHYSPDPVPHTLPTEPLGVIIRSPHLSDMDRSNLTFVCVGFYDKTFNEPFANQISQCLSIDSQWVTWLQLAACLGDTATLQRLANDDRFFDQSRLNNLYNFSEKFTMSEYHYDQNGVYERINGIKYGSVLHAAAAGGHPQAIRTILATGKFDPLHQDDYGNTALHLATHFRASFQFSHSLTDFTKIPDRRIGVSYQMGLSLSTELSKDLMRIEESRRQGCISLLLQAGIDVWQTNEDKRMADPGPKASSEYSAWWYEKVSKETQEAKTSLNAAANAISVTAALVATASYVGPLQPPMGYSEDLMDKMQVGVLSVRIFIVCNTLAFYLALAAIMLSLTPSLPMPQESILDELKLIRRTVTWAVGLLIVSMVAILVAFAFASIAVIPDEGSWNHGGLTIYTLSIGGFICLLVLVLCLFRLLRLAFHKKDRVRRFYKKYVCM